MLEIVALKDAKLTDFRVEAERWRANGHWLPVKTSRLLSQSRRQNAKSCRASPTSADSCAVDVGIGLDGCTWHWVEDILDKVSPVSLIQHFTYETIFLQGIHLQPHTTCQEELQFRSAEKKPLHYSLTTLHSVWKCWAILTGKHLDVFGSFARHPRLRAIDDSCHKRWSGPWIMTWLLRHDPWTSITWTTYKV